ncbi:MAG: lamin tail domain-containing protein [Methanobacteriota archaeon]|nr:MAG: lamin tail domain-containing protein [Euryarchaeota archaeon]
MMLRTKRRMALDERARVPFAVLAVTIFLLSSFSVAYLEAVSRTEIEDRLRRNDLLAIDDVATQLESELCSEIHLVGVEAIRKTLEEGNLPANMAKPITYEGLNETFQGLLSDRYSHRFPARMKSYDVEETGHFIGLFPTMKSTYDFLLTNGTRRVLDHYEQNDFNKIDTKLGGEYGQTNTTHTFLASGYVNITTINARSGLSLNKTLWLETEIDVPLPFLMAKMGSFQSESIGRFSELSRLVKYILTTTSQFKVVQGIGVDRDSLPPDLSGELAIGGSSATDVLMLKDVEFAVNLALLLESAKEFRTWDSQVADEIDNMTDSRAGRLSELLSIYVEEGTVDAADLVSLYLGLAKEDFNEINLENILAQALYGILDQFVLKYLDYFGMMPLADLVWRGIQSVGGILQQAGEAIQDIWDWFSGESPESWYDILGEWLVKRMIPDGGLESEYFLRLLVGNREGSRYNTYKGEIIESYPSVDIEEDGFLVRFVVRLEDDYHTWYSNGSEQPHRFRLNDDDLAVGYDYVCFHIEVSFESPNHQMVFNEVNIGERIDQSDIWCDFFEGYFTGAEEEESTAESIRESVRQAALEIARDATRRIEDLVADYRYLVSNDGHSEIDPADDESLLLGLKMKIEVSMDELIQFYKSEEGKEEIKRILTSFLGGEIVLLEDLKFFMEDNYDSFVDHSSVMQDMVESLALEILENGMSFDLVQEEHVENSNMDHDWAFYGTNTVKEIPAEEIRSVFDIGGVQSQEQFSNLRQALSDDVQLAYQMVKDREVDAGSGQGDKGVLTRVIETSEGGSSDVLLSLFVGGAVDILDGVGLLDMAFQAVENFVDGMILGSEASNTEYLLPVRTGEPFQFWEGSYDLASNTDTISEINLRVDQLVDYLPVQWKNIGPATETPDGRLYVDINPLTWNQGDVEYDCGDIGGMHYTDILSSSDRPFETTWNLRVLGRVPIQVITEERTLLGSGTHLPVWLNRSLEINFSTMIVVYSGWELEGVDYDLSSTILTDIIDFLSTLWDVLAGPLMDVYDLFQKLSGFLRDALRMLMDYSTQFVGYVADALDYAIVLLQIFLSNVLSGVASLIKGFLEFFGLEHLSFEFAGLAFEVKLANDQDRENCQCALWVRTNADFWGFGFDFTTFLVEFEEPIDNLEYYLIIEGNIGFGEGRTARVMIDPFMLVFPHLATIHASSLDGEGDGWALDLYMPELDVYKTADVSLIDAIGPSPSIPVLQLGAVNVDVGVSVKYQTPKEDHLIINEFEMNPPTGPNWVELYNPVWRSSYHSSRMSLDGYELRSANGTVLTILDGMSIGWADRSGGGYLVVELERPMNNPDKSDSLDPGDQVVLYDSEHRIVDMTPLKADEMLYATIIEGMKREHWHEGLTYQRKYDGSPEWILEDATKGRANPRLPVLDMRYIIHDTLRDSFREAWLETDMPFSVDFVGAFVSNLIQKFIDKLLGIMEDVIIEIVFYVDMAVGAVGNGFRLCFVVDRAVLFGLLHWLKDFIGDLTWNIVNPANASPYVSMPSDLPEYLGVRFEAYFRVGHPKAFEKLAKEPNESSKKMTMAISIQPNVPAIVKLAGLNWGTWKIDFGIYFENFPGSSLGKAYSLREDSVVDLWLIKGQIYEVSG